MRVRFQGDGEMLARLITLEGVTSAEMHVDDVQTYLDVPVLRRPTLRQLSDPETLGETFAKRRYELTFFLDVEDGGPIAIYKEARQ